MAQMSEAFGEDEKQPADDAGQHARMAVPVRALNSIEQTLECSMANEAQLVVPPPPFLDGETGLFENADDYGGISLRTAIDVNDMLMRDVQKRWRRQIIIARELGAKRPDGGPFTDEYELACKLEGVEPWPDGDRFVHERRK